MIKKGDFYVIAAVLFISFAVQILCGFSGNGKKTAVIESDGRIFAEYDMSSIKDEKLVDVHGKNTVKITNDYVQVIYADCPDKLDVKQGKITKSGQIIVCLPNKLTVTIKTKRDFDDISR